MRTCCTFHLSTSLFCAHYCRCALSSPHLFCILFLCTFQGHWRRSRWGSRWRGVAKGVAGLGPLHQFATFLSSSHNKKQLLHPTSWVGRPWDFPQTRPLAVQKPYPICLLSLKISTQISIENRVLQAWDPPQELSHCALWGVSSKVALFSAL